MDEVARMFEPGGPLSQRFGDRFEVRPQQHDMSFAVSRAFAEHRHLVVEAGTGVGKSYAYLIPAILHATATGGCVVVSTHTIALQEQLIAKDIPRLAEIMPPFKAALVKGRSNYVSLRRFQFAFDQSRSLYDRDDPAIGQFDKIAEWLSQEGVDGSRASLDFRPLPEIWDSIASDSDNCLGPKCPTYRECHYYNARREMDEAQILIVNHALFFSDLAVRQSNGGFGILPEYDGVVFDEAHTLEQVAVEHFGLRLTSTGLDYNLSRLRGRSRPDKGYLAAYNWSHEATLLERVRTESRRYFEKVWSMIATPSTQSYQRLTDPLPGYPVVVSAISELTGSLIERVQEMKTEDEALELKAIINRTASLGNAILSWHRQSIPDRMIYWMEGEHARKTRGADTSDAVAGFPDRFTIIAAPLDIGAEFRTRLFDEPVTCIMTSATLSTGDPPRFEFFHGRIGFDAEVGDSLRFDSPFDYREQATLFIYPEMADPGGERAQFFEEACAVVLERVLANHGRSLVLFTSYDMLRSMATRLRDSLENAGLKLLTQGEGPPPSQLVSQFMEGGPAVLFGTDSFWQGVDIPGDRLTQVIVVKLPFSVPDHPLMQARLEDIRRTGGNPFFDYQLPEAIIKLKQGFGRLIRTASDHGEVHVLDPRISTKRYGREFLQSLPDCKVIHVRKSGNSVERGSEIPDHLHPF